MNTNWNMVVEVFVPDEVGATRGKIATGCPIGSNRILTAGHVLAHSDAPPQIRWRFDPSRDTWTWSEVNEVRWNGIAEGLDAAVLDITFPDAVESMLLDQNPVPDSAEWLGFGFPDVGERNDGRKGVSLMGHCLPNDGQTLELGVQYEVGTQGTYKDRPEEGWKGASGSPVLFAGLVVGVIQSCPKDFDARRLTAVPVRRLLAESSGFQQAVDYDPVFERDLEKRRIDAKVAIREILSNQNFLQLGKRLDNEFGLAPNDASDRDRATRLTDALFAESLEKVCFALLRVHGTCCDVNNVSAASAVSKIFHLLIPLLYPHGVIRDLNRLIHDSEVRLISVDIGAPVGVGVALAAIDGIETGEDPKFSSRQLSMPHLDMTWERSLLAEGPEEGMHPQVDSQAKNIIQDLGTNPVYGIHLTDTDRDRAEALSLNGDDSVVAKQYAVVLDRRLQFLYKQRRQRFFYAFLAADNSDRSRWLEIVMKRLAELVPTLVVVRLSTKDALYNRDMMIEDCLAEMYRAAEKLSE